MIYTTKVSQPCATRVCEGCDFLESLKFEQVFSMNFDKEKPSISDSLQTEEIKGSEFKKRLERYSGAKARSLAMSEYIKSTQHSRYNKVAYRLGECGSFLWFKNYFERGEIRLYSASFCEKSVLCPFCAIRRAGKFIKAYMSKLESLRALYPHLKPYMLTLTVKDGDSLSERFLHLRFAIRTYMDKRRKYLANEKSKRNRQCVELVKALGGVYSIEIKRGKNSKLWHPHVHFVILCDNKNSINVQKLSAEWHEITGDSFIVDCRSFYSAEHDFVLDGFLEIFKYALKFSDMSLQDNFHAYELLNKQRLVGNFGILRGVEVEENLNDFCPEDEPYIDLFFRYFKNRGYIQVSE